MAPTATSSPIAPDTKMKGTSGSRARTILSASVPEKRGMWKSHSTMSQVWSSNAALRPASVSVRSALTS
jgi:hypothetical protein